jgi:hypothetical protein
MKRPDIKIRAIAPANVFYPKHDGRFRAHIRKCLREFPDACEGSITFDDIEYWFVYVVKNGVVDVIMMPRDFAEQRLNEGGLTTHESFNPLPGSEHKH